MWVRLMKGDESRGNNGLFDGRLDVQDLRRLPELAFEGVRMKSGIPMQRTYQQQGACAKRQRRRLSTQLRWRVSQSTAGGARTEREAATALFTAVNQGLSPDAEFESMAYHCDDGVDLVLRGVYGNLAELRAETLEYLSQAGLPKQSA
jgi:hypothetical protein